MNDQGASVASPTTLGDEIGALLGEGSWTDTDGPSSSDAAGDTPAERQEPQSDTPAPEGTTDAERAGAPPADAAEATPDESPTPVPTADEDDLLAGAVPLTYTVNGESRAFDGVQVLKDNAGAIVTPEALQLLTRRLGERDHLFEQGQARDKKYSDLERLTEWRTKGADGKEISLTGREAVEASRVALGHALAEAQTYRAILSDPMRIAGLLVHLGDGKFAHDETAFKLVNAELANLKYGVESGVRQQIGQMATQLSAPPAPPTSFSQEQLTELAPQAVEWVAKQAGISGLSADSTATLELLAPNYIRPSTAEELRAQPNIHARVDEARFAPVVQRIFAQQAQVAKTVSVNADAAKTNAAKMAAALRGKRPAAPTTPTREPDQSASRSDELWALQERAVSRRSA